MDFRQTFRESFSAIFEKFEKDSIRYAVIGGFALHFWGYSRLTHDLDFIVLVGDKDKVRKSMGDLKFKPFAETDYVAHYEDGNKRVDFIFAQQLRGLKILERACEKDFFGIKLKVARAEDIIGLKVQSMANNPLRWLREMADIENLMVQNKGNLDLDLIGDYFELFHLEKEWTAIVERYNASLG